MKRSVQDDAQRLVLKTLGVWKLARRLPELRALRVRKAKEGVIEALLSCHGLARNGEFPHDTYKVRDLDKFRASFADTNPDFVQAVEVTWSRQLLNQL